MASLRRKNPLLLVQGFSSETASNEFLVDMIAAQTLRAKETGNLLAKKPEIDLLLRLGGTTQIAAAIGRVGSRKGEPFLIVIAGDRSSVARQKPGPGWTRLRRAALSNEELARVERGALLNALRR